MKILFLAPYLPFPATKGTSLRNLHLIRAAARRHAVHLLTFAREDDRDAVETLRNELAGVNVVEPPRRSLLLRLAVLPSRRPDLAWRLYSSAFQMELERLLESQEFDVLQVEGLEMGPYALQLPGRGPGARIPRLVFDDHNAEYALQRSVCRADLASPRKWAGAVYSLLQWPRLRSFERRVCQRAGRVLAVSEADAAALKRLDPQLEPRVIPNGVDTVLFQYRPPGAQANGRVATLVFTGTLDYRPNVDAAIWFCRRILPLVRIKHPGVQMLLVGRDPSQAVRALAGPGVAVTGPVPDVRPYLYRSSVFVAPLRMGSGTRLKVLEAMSCGLPVVSTTIGIEGLAATPGQEALVADDVSGFAAGILSLLDDPVRAASQAERARHLAEERYDWKAILPELERVYEEVGGSLSAG